MLLPKENLFVKISLVAKGHVQQKNKYWYLAIFNLRSFQLGQLDAFNKMKWLKTHCIHAR